MRNAVVVFTKVPETGKTKTRLTVDRGGVFTPEEAKEFYEASLLDVIDCCIASACCDLYVCHDREGDGDYLKRLLQGVSRPDAITEVFADMGETFDKGMQYAADYVLGTRRGTRLAESVLIVGGDMPSLQPSILQAAVEKLETLSGGTRGSASVGAAMVVSADQECGFNILGYTCTTPFTFEGVFYNRDGITALDMVSYKAAEQGIPLGVLEIVPDVDVPVDLAGFISVVKTLQLAARFDPGLLPPRRTIEMLEKLGIEASAPVPQS